MPFESEVLATCWYYPGEEFRSRVMNETCHKGGMASHDNVCMLFSWGRALYLH